MIIKQTIFIAILLMGVLSCSKECEEQNGTLPDIDLTHLRTTGTFYNPDVNDLNQKLEYINDSTVVISFTANNKKIKMTYRIINQGTYASNQKKYN